jgi:hypothetical protein
MFSISNTEEFYFNIMLYGFKMKNLYFSFPYYQLWNSGSINIGIMKHLFTGCDNGIALYPTFDRIDKLRRIVRTSG